LLSLNFLEKKAKKLVSGGIPLFSQRHRIRKRIYRGYDCPLDALFFELKTEPAVNCKAVFLAGNPPASWNFINQ
jgi:hypothetical protein